MAGHGAPVETAGQVSTHVLVYLSAIGLTCRATERGRAATFALIDDWVPHSAAGPRGDDALAELARRFFAAFSPATPADFTTWSGLPSSRAVALIRDELSPAEVHGRPGFRLGEVEPARGLRLLPAFDNYLVGYRERDAVIAERHRGEVFVGGTIRPAVLRDGRVVGRWQLARARTGATVTVTTFETLPRAARSDLDAEIADLARFLALPVTLRPTGPTGRARPQRVQLNAPQALSDRLRSSQARLMAQARSIFVPSHRGVAASEATWACSSSIGVGSSISVEASTQRGSSRC